MDDIANKLLQATNDSSKYETTLTITGAGGFGKTTAVISLCHYPVVSNHFTDGFLFIELGPQATDPSIKLRDIYNLLTGKRCGINIVEQNIKQITSNYFHNLLVIIDDVWYVEDAEPLVKAFSNCKTILTTRMNDIEQYIPSKHSVIIGSMTQHEAVLLLTSGIINSSQLSQEDVYLLDELVLDVHLWPLLLSLTRGHLFHNLKRKYLSYHNAIQNVKAKFHHKGLSAFDKNNIENVNKGRKLAVKTCIEATLEMLNKSLSDRLKVLILYTGIGTALQTAVLDSLWETSQHEAEDTVELLWAYGLVQYTDIKLSPFNITQPCVEVHAVISQFIVERMDSIEANNLIPFNPEKTIASSVGRAIRVTYEKLYLAHDSSPRTIINYLKFKLSEIENNKLPFYVKCINMQTVTDPHTAMLLLKYIKDALMNSPHTISLLPLLDKEIESLSSDSMQILRDAHKFCRKLNQTVQRYLYEKKYDELIQSIEEYTKNYPLCNVAQKAITMVKKILPYCDDELLQCLTRRCEELHGLKNDHNIIAVVLPVIKLNIKRLKQITSSLVNGSPDTELMFHYICSEKYYEEGELLNTNYLIKLHEVAPSIAQREASRQ